MNLVVKAKKTLQDSIEKKYPFHSSHSIDGHPSESNAEFMSKNQSISSQPIPLNYKQLAPPSLADFKLPQLSKSSSSSAEDLKNEEPLNIREVNSNDVLDEEEVLLEELLNQECDSLLLKLQRRMMGSPREAATPNRSQSAPENLKSDII